MKNAGVIINTRIVVIDIEVLPGVLGEFSGVEVNTNAIHLNGDGRDGVSGNGVSVGVR